MKTAVALLVATAGISSSCGKPAPLQPPDAVPHSAATAQAFRHLHHAIALLEAGGDPETIEWHLSDSERVVLSGDCSEVRTRLVDGARVAFGLYCVGDPSFVPAAAALRADLHTSRCFAESP